MKKSGATPKDYWWKGDGGSMWGYPSTNYNSPRRRVVAQVVPFGVASKLLLEYRSLLGSITIISFLGPRPYFICTTILLLELCIKLQFLS